MKAIHYEKPLSDLDYENKFVTRPGDGISGLMSKADDDVVLTTDHLFQLKILGYCEINGKHYRDKLFSKCYSTAWVNCDDDQLLAQSEEGYMVLIPLE